MIEVKRAAPTPVSECLKNVFSQYGEDGILEEIFRRIGTTNKQCFEVGAADGKWFSNSRRLIDAGWQACLIEADPTNWPELDKLDGDKVTVVHGKAEPAGDNSLDSILAQCKFDAAMDLGVIDVDGQDYYLFNGMMKYRPRVIVVEYDANKPDGFVPELNGEGQAGIAAILSIGISKGYFSAATTPTNAIFVVNECRDLFFTEPKPEQQVTPVLEPIGGEAPTIATGVEQEIKITALLSRPRFGLNCFWDAASEALAPWHIPVQSFYGVFWGQCMQKALETSIADGVDWILTLDYDTLFNSSHVQKLIDCLGQNPNIDAVAGLQVRRGRPLALMVRPDGLAKMTGGPIQATTAHFGLTLFRASSIKKMKKPWFWSTPREDGTWNDGRLDDDIYFWGKWRDAGNTLFVHTGCKIGHVEEMVAHYDDTFQVQHSYLTKWRQSNGQKIEVFE